ncbi:MAG TPA: hypothetical protein P5060_01965 [Candidatus Absconditabacterales bacterium]|nr:hypothetical protein [Candidatus Absconditabacterales bacterium]
MKKLGKNGSIILALAVLVFAGLVYTFAGDKMHGNVMNLKMKSNFESYTYDDLHDLECMDGYEPVLNKSCTNQMNEMDRVDESMEECDGHGGVKLVEFDESDRCELFNCTHEEVLGAAETYEGDYYGFMDWIEEYAEECGLENNQYDGIEFECDNGDEMDFDISPSNGDCDEYLEWMEAANIYCSTGNRENISEFELYGLGCGLLNGDLAINNASFVAINDHEAELEIEIENLGVVDKQITGFGHTVKLDGVNGISYSQYDIDWDIYPLMLLEGGDTLLITAELELENGLEFLSNSIIEFSISCVEPEENMSNNFMTAYITGNYMGGNQNYQQIEASKNPPTESNETRNKLKKLLEK